MVDIHLCCPLCMLHTPPPTLLQLFSIIKPNVKELGCYWRCDAWFNNTIFMSCGSGWRQICIVSVLWSLSDRLAAFLPLEPQYLQSLSPPTTDRLLFIVRKTDCMRRLRKETGVIGKYPRWLLFLLVCYCVGLDSKKKGPFKLFNKIHSCRSFKTFFRETPSKEDEA